MHSVLGPAIFMASSIAHGKQLPCSLQACWILSRSIAPGAQVATTMQLLCQHTSTDTQVLHPPVQA